MTTYSYKGIKIHANSKKEAIQKIIAERTKVTASFFDDSVNDPYWHTDMHKIKGIDFNKLKKLIIDAGIVTERPEGCSPNTDEYCTDFLNSISGKEFQEAIVNKDKEALRKFVESRKEANSWDGTWEPICSKNTNFVVEDIISRYYLNKPYKIKVTPEMRKKWMQQAMQEACRIAKVDDVGKLSDGYHTYDDLYFQRLVLWQRICRDHKDKCWKTKCDENGKPWYDGKGWFLIAVDTPKGQYSYHYPMKEWDRFDVKELPKAKHFDGHTSKDV